MLNKRCYRANLEAELLRAHVKLRLAFKDRDESVTATLVRYGPYEVRLYEPPHNLSAGDFLFWIELFDHDSQSPIDIRSSCMLDDAVIDAEYLIAQARQFSDQFGHA